MTHRNPAIAGGDGTGRETSESTSLSPKPPGRDLDRSALSFADELPIRDGVMMRSNSLYAGLLLLLVWLTATAALPAPGHAESNPFPAPASLEPDVRFWTRIYTEVGTNGGLLHDPRDLSVVYEEVELLKGVSQRTRDHAIQKRRERYERILRKLSGGTRGGLTDDEARVLALFPAQVSNGTLSEAAKNIRFQLGQADKFRAGVIRSGAYVDHIEKTLAEMGLPRQIAALPHVESSFTPTAYSRVGAAGLWQFTRSTGQRFMQVDHIIDERLEPDKATVAAARLLEQNYRVTGSWPLAITAYNHGASGMRRAIQQVGSRDIGRIVREYRSPSFGFASRNFYVEFVAASRIADEAERYFGHLVRDTPIDFDRMELPFYATPDTLSRVLGVPVSTLQAANPALRPAVWQGQKRIPRGFEIKVPRAELPRPMQVALADMPKSERHAKQTRDTYHIVSSGESLSRIAARYGVRESELQALNGLRSRNHIRAGQKLRLPSDQTKTQRIAEVRTEQPAPSSPTPVAESIEIPADGKYTVRRGDSIARIARLHAMSESELLQVNRLPNRNKIYPGQVLQVSSSAEQTVARAEPVEPAAAPEVAVRPEPVVEQQASAAAVPAPSAAAPAPEPTMIAEAATIAEEQPLAAAQPDAETPPAAIEPANPPAGEPETLVAVAAEEGMAVDGADGERPGLLADPSDYSVAADRTIEVQNMETLGHYAEWLEIRTSDIRSLNKLKYNQSLPIHGHLKLDFSKVDSAEFENRRIDYHRSMQEEFFTEWEIAGTETHELKRGDTVWVLSQRRFNVPLWLLQQYNPDTDLQSTMPGTQITVPVLKRRESTDPSTSARRATARSVG